LPERDLARAATGIRYFQVQNKDCKGKEKELLLYLGSKAHAPARILADQSLRHRGMPASISPRVFLQTLCTYHHLVFFREHIGQKIAIEIDEL
jgi:hypothetical protein